MHWLVYETNPEIRPSSGSLVKLLETCKSKRSQEPVILGAGEKWKGFSAKWSSVYKYIRENDLSNDDIIVITDARDVLLNRAFGTKHFVNSFNEVSGNGKYLVFGCEDGCCVPVMYQFPPGSIISRSGKKLNKSINTSQYLNSEDSDKWEKINGQWMDKMGAIKERRIKGKRWAHRTSGYALNGGLAGGTVKLWLDYIKKLKIKSSKEDDQALWSELFIQPRSKIRLDYQNALFSNAFTWGGESGCRYSEQGSTKKSVKHNDTKRKPFFIQTPGGHVDDWACYKRLHKYLK